MKKIADRFEYRHGSTRKREVRSSTSSRPVVFKFNAPDSASNLCFDVVAQESSFKEIYYWVGVRLTFLIIL